MSILLNGEKLHYYVRTGEPIMKYEDSVKALLRDDSYLHLLTGLSAECGEVCGIFQKSIYKNNPNIDMEHLTSELGDVLYYVTALANKIGVTLEELQTSNIAKLMERRAKWEKEASDGL